MCVYNFIILTLVEISDRLSIDLNSNEYVFPDVFEATSIVCCSNAEKLVTELCKMQDYLLLILRISCAPSYYKIRYRLQELGEKAAHF